MKPPKTKLIFYLLSLIFINSLPSFAENNFATIPVKKIEASPITVAVMLTEQLDSTRAAATCEYYGYVKQPSQDGMAVYKHPNGSIIHYIFTIFVNGKQYPTVEVRSKGAQKEKDKILEGLNFKKNGNITERHSIGFTTQCSTTPQGFIRLEVTPKSKKQ